MHHKIFPFKAVCKNVLVKVLQCVCVFYSTKTCVAIKAWQSFCGPTKSITLFVCAE